MFFKGCCIGHYLTGDKNCIECKIAKNCGHITRCHKKVANLIMIKNYSDVVKTIKRLCNDRHK